MQWITNIHYVVNWIIQSVLVLCKPVIIFHHWLHVLGTIYLNCCNSLLTCFTKSNLHKRQMAKKFQDRALKKTTKYQHIRPILHSLPWFPAEQGIQFKICLIIIHKALRRGITVNQVTHLWFLLTSCASK